MGGLEAGRSTDLLEGVVDSSPLAGRLGTVAVSSGGDITVSTSPPHDSAMNLISGPINSIAELGNRVRITIGPISAEITAESLHRLGLQLGQPAFASFKATGTRLVANGRG